VAGCGANGGETPQAAAGIGRPRPGRPHCDGCSADQAGARPFPQRVGAPGLYLSLIFFARRPTGGGTRRPPPAHFRSWFPDGRAGPWWLRARRTRFFLWLPAWRATSAAAASIQDVAGLVGPPSKRHPPGAAGASAMSRQCRIAAAHGHSSRCLGVFPLPFAKRTVPRLRRGALPTAGPPKRVAAHVDGLRATTGTRNVLCGRAGSGRRGNDMGTDRPQHRGRGWRNEIAP